ncbi:MAG: MFS transporter [Chitinophagaceae bacterium]|jgi:FHS family L-fucose permease-like MFS transporter|nr:MFS transporter [Chitinophagaceae bacterium]
MSQTKQATNTGALSTLVVVFFFWGFIASSNSVFIPFCKHKFNLDQFQSQLVDFAFYLAYYIGALGLFAYGAFGGKDLVGKWGYKKSIVYGLLFSAIGAAAMIIAVNANTFTGMLVGLFIVALGFSLQQTAAQPFAIALGDPSTGASRVNLAGGINSFGTSIGPIVVAFALFGSAAAITDDQIAALSLSKVVILYTAVGILFLAAAAMFHFSKKVPSGISEEKIEPANKALYLLLIMTGVLIVMFVPIFNSYKIDPTSLTDAGRHDLETTRLKWLFGALATVVVGLLYANFQAKKNENGWGAMKYPQLVLGMLALFVYVGAEVAIGSNLGELLKQADFGSIPSSKIAPYISMYWGSMMIGRWAGAISAFEFKSQTNKILTVIVPLVAFGIVIGVNSIAQYDMTPLYMYIVCIFIQIAAFFISQDKPAKTLLVFSLIGLVSMLVGVFTKGDIAIYAFLTGGIACSIMWPCIFALSISGIGKYTTQGAAFLIMMILGGGIIPPIQGKLSDYLQSSHLDTPGYGIHNSFWVPLFCFAYILVFAIAVKGILKKQGINYEETEVAGGH